MLSTLIVRNFAIIDHLQVEFGPGFNVLTGETGAGKSILIGALQLLLGARAKTDLIRTGEEEATVEAVFEPIDSPLQVALRDAGLPVGDELLLKRTVQRNGKNRIYVNGSLVTLGQWQPLGERLVRIYGQHEQQILTHRENHLSLLDRFGAYPDILDSYREAYRKFSDLKEQIRRLDADDRQRQQRMDILAFQCQELQTANLIAGEDEELEQERALLVNAEKLQGCTTGGFNRLYGGEGAAVEKLVEVAGELEAVQGVSAELDGQAEILRSLQYQLEDVAQSLREFGGRLEFDPARLNHVEERLALLGQLKRKYAPSVQELLDYLDEARSELDLLQNAEENQEQLQQKLDVLRDEMMARATELTKYRQKAADGLARAVEEQLADLAMKNARFRVVLEATEPGASGCEMAEFLLSANAGEDVRPLIQVASGGELSRIMLALRGASPETDLGGTSIYDEVDAGIGGATATVVGDKLKTVASGTQVLCITHLPQVAAFGESHYRVVKNEIEGRTRTEIRFLDDESRVQEMARMLGGAAVTERTLAHAREMIFGHN